MNDVLVILTPGFPAGEGDSACLPPQQVFVRALNKVFPRLKVVILAIEYPHREDEYEWFGNTVYSLDGWTHGKLKKLATLVRVWRLLRRLRTEQRVVGVLSWWCGPCALAGNFFSRWLGLPHFTWILGQDARAGNRWVRWIRPDAARLVAMSGFLAEEFQRNYGVRPGHVVANGIDPSMFGCFSGRRDIDLLGVGNLTKLKRYDVFVSVVDKVSRRLQDVRGVVIGKGEEGEGLQRMAGELGCRVDLIGERAHGEVLGYMQRSRVLLHTSAYEGFGTVMIEALYAGAHVISFVDTVGVPVKNWHVVGSEEEMVEVAVRLLADPSTVYEPVRPFLMEDSARAMMELYEYV
ncbi:MAG: glycosyltransferase family 4 protein [Bacteroidetes bacterium]|nr:glycosyltransferase family 4 protein [Bacteroidota bacterium]